MQHTVLTPWAELLSYPETRANFSKVPSGVALVKTLLSPIRICIDGVEIPVVLVVSPPLLNAYNHWSKFKFTD